MSQLFHNHVNSSLDEIVHMQGQFILKLNHISCLACLCELYVFIELIFIQKLPRWKGVQIHFNWHKKLQYFLFVVWIVNVAILISESQQFSGCTIFISIHAKSAFSVCKLDSPAHWKHFFVKSFISKLNIYPFEEPLTILEAINLELNLNKAQCDKEYDICAIIWRLVLSRLL